MKESDAKVRSLVSGDDCLKGTEASGREIFILTKPPRSNRAKLCFKLMEQSQSAVLYLVGDGIFNLLSHSIEIIPKDRIYACREDMNARGVQLEETPIVVADFYEKLIDDVMISGDRIYTF